MAGIWARTNTLLLLLVLMALLALIAMLAAGVRGGPLDPLGAPGSTDSVKLPGTPISTAPYTIAQSGHYYVTRNLSVTGGATAITINVNDVSLDLGGFTVAGNDGAGSIGVLADGRRNISISNGTVRDFQLGLSNHLGFDVRIDQVHAHSNVRGFHLGDNTILTRCTAMANTETGIVVFGTKTKVSECSATDNLVDGFAVFGNYTVITDCVAHSNDGNGIIVLDSGERNTISQCQVISNGADGIRLDVGTAINLIERSYIRDSTGADIRDANSFFTFNVVRENVVDNMVFAAGAGGYVVDNICQGSITNPPATYADHANVDC